ncbi:PREDICTED: magnesium-dependent phosphatase 1-like [Ipomoea nil]|uniref:magnesium-dependent phosphatase 1-like n=1 Tax=Ipomoea nil TaxID=35883 RepID=UPI000901E4F4|nr:PREDICTED: magnesium-dependent phosphatase 1-like [Ipomoea nil]
MEEHCKSEALHILTSFQHLPRLVVFDLDYTLWPFFCNMRCKCEVPILYPQVKGILCALKEVGVGIGIASRSPTPHIADAYLWKLGIKSMVVAKEVFPSWSPKTEHFQRIHRGTGLLYNEMLFFDDETRNIEAVSKMGVTSILVTAGKGIDLKTLWQGLSAFNQYKRFSIKPQCATPMPPRNQIVHPEPLPHWCCECQNFLHMPCKFKRQLRHHQHI